MENKALHLALTKMGYRKIKAEKWAKPVGYHLLTYEEDRNEFTNWFTGLDGNFLRWNTEKIEEETKDEKGIIDIIKAFEATTKLDYISSRDVNFEFLTLKEHLEWEE